MIEWDSRMQNNHSVKVLKAAIPFLDVEVGQDIDMAGLLNAVRPFLDNQDAKFRYGTADRPVERYAADGPDDAADGPERDGTGEL